MQMKVMMAMIIDDKALSEYFAPHVIYWIVVTFFLQIASNSDLEVYRIPHFQAHTHIFGL